ncbi:MAG: hypothetical protein SFX72_04510 [Isosphaeraceae bacterium]|nr:hypothetical protein [Isosphaeraceae bacterium]
MMNPRDHANRRRRGLVAAALVVALIVVVMMLGVLLRSTLLQRVDAVGAERSMQAEALADAGAERACARLVASSEYTGEVWELSAEALGRREGALVTIRVERVEGRPDRRSIFVQADYPRPAERRARRSKTLLVEIPRIRPSNSGDAR